ncbi:putative transcription factor C2H2 family [Helianthus annuus]|nr:putative transcription factor C2H2 family [Helianthus annuus]
MGMGIQVLYLAIKIPQYLTVTIISNIVSHLVSLMFAALGLFKSPPDPDDISSSAANYILILDGASPSLLPVPVHVITAAIKNKVPVVPYDDFVGRYGGPDEPVCTVCFECIDGCDLIREIVNCKHVFHRECLDKWVDVGQVNCPLCRSMLLPPKKLLSAAGSGVPETALSDVAPVM